MNLKCFVEFGDYLSKKLAEAEAKKDFKEQAYIMRTILSLQQAMKEDEIPDPIYDSFPFAVGKLQGTMLGVEKEPYKLANNSITADEWYNLKTALEAVAKRFYQPEKKGDFHP